MATYQDTLMTKILVDAGQATTELQKFMALGANMGKITAAGGDVNHKFKQLKDTLGKNSAAFRVMKTEMDAVTKKAKVMKHRFDMNTLSWMFGGMALQRVGLMMMRFMIPSMEQLNQLNTKGAKQVMGMAAAFQFLKISLFETLSATPWFQKFVEFIVKGAIWLSEWTQKHPKVVAMAAAIAGIAVVLGTIAIGVGIFKQLSHLTTLLGFTGSTSVGSSAQKLSNFLKTGFSFFLIYQGIKDFQDGGIMASLDELIALSLIWFAGIGWGLAFYMVSRGIKHVTGKDFGEWIDTAIEGFQQRINKQKLYFPADLGKPTGLFPSLEHTLLGKSLDKIHEAVQFILPLAGTSWFEGIGVFNKELAITVERSDQISRALEGNNKEIQLVDDSLVGHSLVPSMVLLNDSVEMNVKSIPLMTNELIKAKDAIDSIPNETHKYIYIHTVNVGGDSNENLRENVSSVVG